MSAADKQRNQDDALRKLMGENYPIRDRPTASSKPTPSNAPMSLAAFIGGRATGPRLTKHTPQQDAHDPTQFEQRTHITAPHPVFGRGGVAMPGMVGRASSNGPRPKEDSPSVNVDRALERDRKISTPSIVTPSESKPTQVINTHITGRSYAIRDRTLSTPAPATIVRTATSPQVPDRLSTPYTSSPVPASRSPVTPTSSVTPLNQATSISQASSLRSASPMRRSQTTLSSTTPIPSPSSPKHSISTPSLARPIEPAPRHSLGPQIPASQNPSPAFLRAPTPKEPTPSISRLQGRGFVQSFVKATTTQFGESPSGPSSPAPAKRESGPKKNVLDRWQFAAEGNSPKPSIPPVISPKPIVTRKFGTFDSPSSFDATPPSSTPLKPTHTGKSTGLRSMASLPSLSQAASNRSSSEEPRDSITDQRGLGSSTTMISYIKPTKTGDEPVVSAPLSHSRTASPAVDELGIRVNTRSVERVSTSAGLPLSSSSSSSPGKPLSHVRLS